VGIIRRRDVVDRDIDQRSIVAGGVGEEAVDSLAGEAGQIRRAEVDAQPGLRRGSGIGPGDQLREGHRAFVEHDVKRRAGGLDIGRESAQREPMTDMQRLA
jgi:hypothetical protein